VAAPTILVVDPARASRFPFVPGGTPITIVGAGGSYLHTADGRAILDGGGGAIVTNIGHGRPEVVEAATAALTGNGYVVPLWATEWRVRLVERLTGHWLPSTMTRCLFTSGGSEAVDTALRVARQHHVSAGRPERWKVIGRSISYHGATLATLAVANHDRRRASFTPLLLDLPKVDPMDPDALAKVIEAEGPDTVAAFIAEPVSGSSGGALVPPPDYWPRVREICDEYGVLLIADEVMTGLGRTGRRFAVEHWDVTPDLLVGGKGLGGGYVPLGGVFATDAVVDPIAAAGDAVMFFTFSASDVACAIADRVLQIMEDEHLVERADRMGGLLRQRLEEEFVDHPHVADVRGLGLMLGLELVRDRDAGTSFGGGFAPTVVAEALRRDLWIYPAGSAAVPDAVMFGPPFTISEDEIDQIVTRTRLAVDAAALATLAAADA
jgi:adenosylmethionine-8-amino-7-oxononanoate aminotransferase